MLIFGPFRAIPKDEDFVIFNLSSQTELIPRLPGLFMVPAYPYFAMSDEEDMGKRFDHWYYDYIISDPTACNSLMQILTALYDGRKVYVCIADYASDITASMVNEGFMKVIQARYDIKYAIINTPEDYSYIPKDGCDFASVAGIRTFDEDRKRFMQLSEENKILYGVAPTYDESY